MRFLHTYIHLHKGHICISKKAAHICNLISHANKQFTHTASESCHRGPASQYQTMRIHTFSLRLAPWQCRITQYTCRYISTRHEQCPVATSAILLPEVTIEALEACKHEYWIKRLLFQFAAPIPCTCEPAIDARASVTARTCMYA
jgi:hypothetical protein